MRGLRLGGKVECGAGERAVQCTLAVAVFPAARGVSAIDGRSWRAVQDASPGARLPVARRANKTRAFRPRSLDSRERDCRLWRRFFDESTANHGHCDNSQARQCRQGPLTALDAGGGPAAADAHLGAAQLSASRQADQAGPDRLVRLRRPSRRHRRTLVRQHDRGGQRKPHARRRAELRRVRGAAVHAARRRGRSRRRG